MTEQPVLPAKAASLSTAGPRPVIVFLHIPKTAGTTFRLILESNFGISACHTNQTKRAPFRQSDLDFARKFFPRLRALAGHTLVDPLRLSLPGAFYMTFLREPIQRVVSHYQDTAVRGGSMATFEESLQKRDRFENLAVKRLAGGRDLDKAKRALEQFHFVGFTEKFDLSLRVFDRLSPYRLDLRYKRRIVARDNTIKQQLLSDPRMVDMAREFNQLDLALYEFAEKEVFPRLCEQAGLGPDDTVESPEVSDVAFPLRYRLGRFYNKCFRLVCKVRP
jgi:hypothetical protein